MSDASDAGEASRVLAAIPGWSGASTTALDGGLSNQSFRVEQEGQRAVLKFDRSPRPHPYASRTAEAAVQMRAAAQDLAPHVLYVSDTVLLSEYAEGKVWTDEDLNDDGQLDALAAALRGVHRLGLTGRVFDARKAARQYFENLGDADPVIAARCLKTVLETQAPANLCVCHNDLVAGNIIDADGLMFIDWEFAADNDPLFDLATIVAHHRLSTEQAERLLDAYFDGNGAAWLAPLAVQERLYEALAWLWRESRG